MEKLIAGVRNFRREVHPSKKELFDKLATGQSPKVLFVTCSDSRVDPSLITSTDPGDLFVVRNAGNLVPPFGAAPSGEEGTVEYAVAALGVTDIVVCGHSGCGAMKGLLDPDSLETLPAVASWLKLAGATRAALDASSPEGETDAARLDRAIELNTLRQLDNLRGHPAVAAALATGKISLHAWVYDIGSGSVRCHDSNRGAFVDLEESALAR